MKSLSEAVGPETWRAPLVGWMANIMVSWSIAGGTAGGVLMATLLLTSRMHSMGVIPLVIIVAAVGSMLGLVHGAVLGYLGRAEPDAHFTWPQVLLLAAVSAGSVVLSTAGAVWLVVTTMGAQAGVILAQIALAGATLVTLLLFIWASWNGWEAIETATARWPEKRLASALVLGALLAISFGMLVLRGAIPGTGIRLSPIGAILLIVAAVLWIVSPVVIVMLRLAGRSRSRIVN